MCLSGLTCPHGCIMCLSGLTCPRGCIMCLSGLTCPRGCIMCLSELTCSRGCIMCLSGLTCPRGCIMCLSGLTCPRGCIMCPSSVVCKLFTFQASSPKPLGLLEPNLAGMFLGWSSTKLLFFVPVGYSIWLPGPIICSDWLKFQRSSSLKLMN